MQIRQLLRSLAGLVLVASAGAQATVISASAGESLIFNFAAPAATAVSFNIDYVASSGSPIGKVSFFDLPNLGGGGGSAWLSSASGYNLLNLPGWYISDTPLLDGFSVLIEVTSGTFTVGRDGVDMLKAIYGLTPTGFDVVTATLGTDSRATTTPPTPPSVPEPSSLLLASLAGLALLGTRRR